MDIPSVYSSNGDGFYEHDRTCTDGTMEKELSLDAFPSPQTLWQRYKEYKGVESAEQEKIAAQDYLFDGEELTEQGIIFENLKEAVNKEMDIFDLVCHTAFDQPPLSRAERVNHVKKRDYFTKYGEQARQVLEALLDKYADEGIKNIEDIKVLKVNPFDRFGTPLEIVELFGGKMQYQQALNELEYEIYKLA